MKKKEKIEENESKEEKFQREDGATPFTTRQASQSVSSFLAKLSWMRGEKRKMIGVRDQNLERCDSKGEKEPKRRH